MFAVSHFPAVHLVLFDFHVPLMTRARWLLGFLKPLAEVAQANTFPHQGCPFSGLWLCPDGLCPLGAWNEFSLLSLTTSSLHVAVSPTGHVERKAAPFFLVTHPGALVTDLAIVPKHSGFHGFHESPGV